MIALALAAGAALAACGGDSSGAGDGRIAVQQGPSNRQLATVAAVAAAPRVMEKLNRGVVAVRASSTSIFISWRLLGLDPAGIGFNVYRSAAGATPVKLNASPLTGGTNYSDTSANPALANTYTVRPVIGGVEQAASLPYTLAANRAVEPIVRIPLQPIPGEGYRTKYVWVGDLDGDGEYDYVIDRIAPFDPTNDDIGLGNQYLEAYKRDGTRLWQIDLGPSSRDTYNISPGAATLSMGMYDGATVYDLNSDGRAEVILKVADGVRFGNGTTFGNADPKKQFIAVLNGQTGVPLATRAFPATYAAAGELGTQLGIGYPDGVNPSIYFWGRNRNADKSFNDVFASWSWNGGTAITENWLIPLGNSGPRQASHQMRIIDVDGDGRDEMATGNFMVNSDGTLRYILSGVVHGDRFFIGRMDRNNPDMLGYGVQQNNPSGLLEYFYNARTGAIAWTHHATDGLLHDVGRGLVGDVDPRFAGYEVWSFEGLYNGPTGALTEPNTELRPYPTHTIWWDGDVLSEGLNDYKIEKWNPLEPTTTGATPRLVTMSNYGARIHDHNPMFFGDILGDWRTEVVTLNSTYSELVIFTTNVPTSTRLYTMTHNPTYRNHMTIKGYMQSGLPDYYLGDGMATPPAPNIVYAGGATSQLEVGQLSGGAVAASNYSGYRGSGFVDFPASGGIAQLSGVNGGAGGSKTLTIRYANGGANSRTGVLRVNGTAYSLRLYPTGGWNRWAEEPITVTLAAGTANVLRFESSGQDMANIDEVTVP
jgi:hypothetical protein